MNTEKPNVNYIMTDMAVERIPELDEYLARNISEIEDFADNVIESNARHWDEINKAFLAVL